MDKKAIAIAKYYEAKVRLLIGALFRSTWLVDIDESSAAPNR